jgi:hypothetical protein
MAERRTQIAQLAREREGRDPVDGGGLFVSSGRAASRLKVLCFDSNGLCPGSLETARIKEPQLARWVDVVRFKKSAQVLIRLSIDTKRRAST